MAQKIQDFLTNENSVTDLREMLYEVAQTLLNATNEPITLNEAFLNISRLHSVNQLLDVIE